MRLIVAICIAFFGIISIPFILLFIWLFVYICSWLLSEIFKCVFVGVSSIKKSHLKHANEDYKYDKEIEEIAKRREKENLPPTNRISLSSIWDAIVKWTDEHYIITAFIASFIVAIIFLLLTLCVDGYVTDKERVVLAFVGVLATFVVLTNHAQSFERIKEMEKLIKDTKDELREMMDNQKIDNEKTLKSKITESTSKHMLLTFRFLQACQDLESYTLAKELFEDAKKKPDKIYKIQPQDGEEINARLVISRNTIKFVSSTYPYAMIHNNQISKVDDKNYDYAKVSTIVVVLGQIDEIEKTPKSTSL